jgi:hypothetical protein
MKNTTTKSERKIIGYKLIKPEYKEVAITIAEPRNWCNPIDIIPNGLGESKLKEAGVLDLWFEPVYESKFKRGDKVVLLDLNPTDNFFDRRTNNFTFTIGKIYTLGGSYFKDENPQFFVEKNNYGDEDGLHYAIFRKATPEEIKASTIEIGGCEVCFLNHSILIDDQQYYLSEIKQLVNLIKRGQIKSLNVGCNGQYKVDLELLTKILHKFDK